MLKRSVFLIDDDPVFLKIMQSMLATESSLDLGYFDDPLQALDQITAVSPDIVFLDMNMPTMSGVRVLSKLAELRYRGDVVLLSSYEKRILESVRDYSASIGVNVTGVLNKPVPKEVLLTVIAGLEDKALPVPKPSMFDTAFVLSGEELRAQWHADHLQLAYQPKYRMLDGRLRSVEALARWKHGDRLLPPASFIPAVYSEGLINEFSLLVYERLMQDLQCMHAAGHKVSAAINLSLLSLADNGFVNALFTMADHYGVDMRHVIIEVSEKQPFGKLSLYLDNLLSLIFRGARLSLDNFGGGYFALLLLKQIPFAEMKIDPGLVKDACLDSRTSVILRNSVRLGLDFGMQVVAVGGESRADWDFSKELGCDFFQGYHKSSPLLLDDLLTRLDRDA
jgi:EAL domain-containing protein (putative c-di-GMP-specific phosphodiesterase class I)/ActR/RegA family two-component response regulator